MKKIVKETKTVHCNLCGHTQDEPNVAVGDKFAWQCKSCNCIFEGEDLHLLQGNAKFCFPNDGGGNVCTGFGGLSGQVHHQVVEEHQMELARKIMKKNRKALKDLSKT